MKKHSLWFITVLANMTIAAWWDFQNYGPGGTCIGMELEWLKFGGTNGDCLSSYLPFFFPFFHFFLLLFANISWCLFCSRLKNKETTWKRYALICGGHYTLIFLNSFIPITNKKIREPSIFYYIRVAVSGNKYQISICSFSPHQSFPYIWASTMAVKENLDNLS